MPACGVRSIYRAGTLHATNSVPRIERGMYMRLISRISTRSLFLAALCVASTGVGISSAGTPHGFTYYVGSPGDSPSSATLAVCEQALNTTCTLRTALALATLDGPSKTDTISIRTLSPITVTSANGPLVVQSIGTIYINGRGVAKTILTGANKVQVMAVDTGVIAYINNLTIENGYAQTGSGAGVNNSGTLNLNNVNFTANISSGSGSAVYSYGTLNLQGGLISGNFNEGGCGALYVAGTSAVISGVTVVHNGSDCGGGVAFEGGVQTLKNSFIGYNTSRDYDDGGGVYIRGGSAQIVNNTIVGNSSAEYGGGISVGTGNVVLIQNNTIINNVALQGGGGIAISSSSYHLVTIEGNVITGNTEWPNVTSQCLSYSDYYSTSFNTVGPAADQGCEFNGPGDKTGQKVLLSPLAQHGGPTNTYLLAAGSAGLGSVAAANCPARDSRGVVRPAAGAGAPCDAGAVEVGLTASAVTCNTISGKLSATWTLSGCTPSISGAYGSASGRGFALTGSSTQLTWHTSGKTSSLSLGALAVVPNKCSGGSSEFRVNGSVTQSSGKSPLALSKVSFLMCQTATGSLSLLHGTKAKI